MLLHTQTFKKYPRWAKQVAAWHNCAVFVLLNTRPCHKGEDLQLEALKKLKAAFEPLYTSSSLWPICNRLSQCPCIGIVHRCLGVCKQKNAKCHGTHAEASHTANSTRLFLCSSFGALDNFLIPSCLRLLARRSC